MPLPLPPKQWCGMMLPSCGWDKFSLVPGAAAAAVGAGTSVCVLMMVMKERRKWR